MKKLKHLALGAGGALLGFTYCIIPDKGIIIHQDCGHSWCATASSAYALDPEFKQPIQVLEGDPHVFVTRCVCLNEEQHCTFKTKDLDNPTQSVELLLGQVRSAAAAGCLQVAQEQGYNVDGPLPAGHMNCIEAANAATVYDSGQMCTLEEFQCSSDNFVCQEELAHPTTSHGAEGATTAQEAAAAGEDGEESGGEAALQIQFVGMNEGDPAELSWFQGRGVVTRVAGAPVAGDADIIAFGGAVISADTIVVVTRRDGEVMRRTYRRE